LALATDNICETVDALRSRGMVFQDTPDSYYDGVEARIAGHKEDLAELQKQRILIDGSAKDGILLQIFTANVLGPIFFRDHSAQRQRGLRREGGFSGAVWIH
jgi:4-hydroxyphenylpyruvate dioxygenase